MLCVVATPIGNLEDLSARARRTLADSETVLCEDTRRTRQLLTRFGLSIPVERYQENRPKDVRRALERLAEGRKLALVSDGGLPVLSDPGRGLVASARREGFEVTVLPGPSAASTALAGSGLPGGSFIVLGFLPRTPGKIRKRLEQAKALDTTVIVFESPFRIAKLLGFAIEVFGENAQAVVARELTKVHEEWVTGTAREVFENLSARKKILGECVALFHPRPFENPEPPLE